MAKLKIDKDKPRSERFEEYSRQQHYLEMIDGIFNSGYEHAGKDPEIIYRTISALIDITIADSTEDRYFIARDTLNKLTSKTLTELQEYRTALLRKITEDFRNEN